MLLLKLLILRLVIDLANLIEKHHLRKLLFTFLTESMQERALVNRKKLAKVDSQKYFF